jgi:phosphatidylglycerol---prolipoprotein diacylglyceryl transferase
MILATLPYPQLDPVLLQLGPVSLRWYALAYLAGLALAWWGIVRALRIKSLWAPPPFNGKPPASGDDIVDLATWSALGVIAGGRLGWDLFYGVILCSSTPDVSGFCRGMPGDFLVHPWRLLAEWHGWVPQLAGMSFHGGLIGVVVAVWLYCRKHKLALLPIADLACAFAPIGLFFGRIANFVNGELWGRVTDVPWGMTFCSRYFPAIYGTPCPGGLLPRHPSQLYEAALEGVLLFAVLQIGLRVFHWHRRPGLLAAVFFAGYGLFRFVVEFFREPDAPFLGALTMGMALSLLTWVAAAALFYAALKPKVA